MSKQKITNSDVLKMPVAAGLTDRSIAKSRKAPEPEVVALELDESDFGGDPYNHTGSFCALNFDKDR